MCDAEKKVVSRGEVYYVMYNEAIGSEMGVGRPGIVISSDMVNASSDVVTVVYTTTQRKNYVYTPSIVSTSKPSWALCNQVVTVSKLRLSSKMCTLTKQEMERVDRALRLCLDLVPEETADDDECEELNKKIAGLEEELMAKKIEIAMVEKMYEKALEMLAGVHLTNDLQKKPEPPKVRVPRLVPDEPEVVEERTRATTVIMDDLEYHGDGKVNVNTASAVEIHEKAGLPLTVAYGVTGYRRQNGPYSSLEDLLKAPRVVRKHLEKYGKMLTV